MSHVNALQIIPFELEKLKAELPTYLSKTDDISDDLDQLEWWNLNATVLSHWSNAVKKVLAIQPSSAAAERVFSLSELGI